MLRHAAVLAIAISACAPHAHSPTFQAAPEPPRAQEHHAKITPAGTTGLTILGAVIVGFSGIAILAVPHNG